MSLSAPGKIRTETDTSTPLAVIYNGGSLVPRFKSLLESHGLRTLTLLGSSPALSILEKPLYLFYFLSRDTSPNELRQSFREALEFSSHHQTKVVLIKDNLSTEIDHPAMEITSHYSCSPSIVELTGRWSPDGEATPTALDQILHLAFSDKSSTLSLLSPHSLSETPPSVSKHLSVEEVLTQLEHLPRQARAFSPLHKINRISVILLGFFLILFLLLLPLMGFLTSSLLAARDIKNSQEALLAGRFSEAEKESSAARQFLTITEVFLNLYSPLTIISPLKLPLEKISYLLSLAQSVVEVENHFALVGPRFSSLPSLVMNSSPEGLPASSFPDLGPDLKAINIDLGLIEAELDPLLSSRLSSPLSFFGYPREKLSRARQKLTEARLALSKIDPLVSVLPNILADKTRRTYLLVFQNSTELRPTGGFIGSYALVNVQGGKIINYKINDIYTADGQLKGQITPPDEVLHFLGQPSWYMRDANFAPDFPLTAERLRFFLEKETRDRADGVIAVNMGMVQKILRATGPLALPAYQEEVTADNFFQKAEAAAEINFFPGSNQKRDYLGAVFEAILGKITSGANDYMALGLALEKSLEEKDLLFYFLDPALENLAKTNGWAGEISPLSCQGKNINCLAVIDSNFGANKANYFLDRRFTVSSIIGKGGDESVTVKVVYQNNSPSITWPGGPYKNYLRFLLPLGSRVINVDFGPTRQATFSSLLTANILSKISPQQSLVFQSTEYALADHNASRSAYLSLGTLLEVPIKSQRTVSLTYYPPYRVDYTSSSPHFVFNLLKQPGTGPDPVVFSLDFPSFLSPLEANLVNSQRLVYNTDLSKDLNIGVKFRKN